LTDLHRTLRDDGRPSTVIYVTHDQVEAMTMGERICVLKEGTIQQLDTPSALYERPANAFVAGFIGSPEMNLHAVDVAADGAALQWGGLTLPLRAPQSVLLAGRGGRRVTLGLRPEHIGALATRAGTVALPGTLRLLENMGSEVFVHADIGGLPFTARITPDV